MVTVPGGVICGGKASRGGCIYSAAANTSLTLKNINLLGNASSSGGAVYANNGFTVENVCVAGNLAENAVGGANGGGLYLNEGSFSLKNSKVVFNTADATAEGYSAQGGGIYVSGKNSVITEFSSMDVSYNRAQAIKGSVYGGGIAIRYNSNCSMVELSVTDSVINGNRIYMSGEASTKVTVGGGGIHAAANIALCGNTTINGNSAAIASGEQSYVYGGGINISGQCVLSIESADVSICDNQVSGAFRTYGAGILVSDNATVKMTAGKITGNKILSGQYQFGAGVCSMTPTATPCMTLGGDAVIYGNQDSAQSNSNLFLGYNSNHTVYSRIAIDSTVLPTQNMKVGLALHQTIGGEFSQAVDADYKANFVTDKEHYIIEYKNSKLYWTPEYQVTFKMDGGTEQAAQTVLRDAKATRPEQDPTRENSEFVGWFDTDGNAFDFDAGITDNTVIVAKWLLKETTTEETTVFVDKDNQTEAQIQLSGDTGIAASGLEEIAQEIKSENKEVTIRVVLSVEEKQEEQVDQQQAEEIKEANPDKDILYLEIGMEKVVGDMTPESLVEVPYLVEVILPFDGENKENVILYRYHEGDENPLTQFTYATTGAEDTFYIEDNLIHLFTKKFCIFTVSFDNLNVCFYSKVTVPTVGKHQLNLNGKNAGTFTFAKDQAGWTLKNSEKKYVAFDAATRALTLSDTPYVWKYDGGLYATAGGNARHCSVGKYYLSLKCGKLYVSSYYTAARTVIEMESTEHSLVYLHNGDGEHTAYCVNCGCKEDETHIYDGQTHKCICGLTDPSYGGVTNVSVKEKVCCKDRQYSKKASGVSYEYRITAQTVRVKVSKIEYALEKGNWKTGTAVKSAGKIESFYIRVTDSKKAQTLWKYENGQVIPIMDAD